MQEGRGYGGPADRGGGGAGGVSHPQDLHQLVRVLPHAALWEDDYRASVEQDRHQAEPPPPRPLQCCQYHHLLCQG